MKKRIVMRLILFLGFVVYCVFLCYFLFLDARITHLTYWEHIKRSSNLIPFNTIGEYILRLSKDAINLSSFVKNILGNIILFLPMGFFVPCFSIKIRKLSKVILVSLLIIFCVELLQLFSTLGSFDIDDILLNMIGSIIGYGIFMLPSINVFMKKIHVIS